MIIDSKESERSYAVKKLGYKYDFVDTEASSCFQGNRVTLLMVKSLYGFNHFRLHDSIINAMMIEAHYLRYNNVKTWNHVIRCVEIIEIQK